MQILFSVRLIVLRSLILAMLVMGMTLSVQPTRAASCTVTSTADSGGGTLRAMVNDPSCDVINFNADTAIALDSTLTISNNVQIDGSGQIVSISGQNQYRVLFVNAGVTASLNDLKIAHGATPTGQSGGGILNEGTLTVTGSTFDSNNAEYFGGGLFNDGILAVKDSTFYKNTTYGTDSNGNETGWGGAIWNQGNMTVTDSTFDSNQAYGDGAGINNRGSMTVTGTTFTGNSSGYYGAAIYDNAATATVANSTFTGNSAGASGGAIYNHNSSVLTLLNDTFSGNTNWSGADIYNNLSTLNFANNILTDPFYGPDCFNAGTIGRNTNNLVEDGSCSATWSGDPLLGGLADNGGPTQTMALLSGSPAIDVGDASICSASPVDNRDQRGVTRPQGARCDLGAYEYGPIIPLVTSSTPAANAAVASLTMLTVTFNQDMLNDGSAKAANIIANYLLVERGPNGSFDTLSCKGGRQGDDARWTISGASYNPGRLTASLTLADPLTNGHYRLLVCGTTSIWSVAGLELNNGANDATIDFTVSPSALPSTGFAPGQMTVLGTRTTSYAGLGDLWLEIPRLDVQAPIVGVPQSADGTWDVSWLGNDIGWLNGTAFPTWEGNSVLAGHVYNAYGQPGVFRYIDTLGWGDQVIIHAGGALYVYEVREVMQVGSEDTAAMLKHEELHWITLMTCRGYDEARGDYHYRVLVRAVLVDVR